MLIASAKVIEHANGIGFALEIFNDMRPDEAGSSCDEDIHGLVDLLIGALVDQDVTDEQINHLTNQQACKAT